jgi:putative N-acetylmannosamine-6-phosphate epimerase
MKTVLDNLKGKLVVSCQALENEPLHSPFIMSRMALAAAQGGAAAIRANSVVDIEAIKQQCLFAGHRHHQTGLSGKRGVYHRHDERGG